MRHSHQATNHSQLGCDPGKSRPGPRMPNLCGCAGERWSHTARSLRSRRDLARVEACAGVRELGRCRCWHSPRGAANAAEASPCRAEFDARGSRRARAGFGQKAGKRRISASGASSPAAATSCFLQAERCRAARAQSLVELSPIGAAAGCFWSGSTSELRLHSIARGQRGPELGLPLPRRQPIERSGHALSAGRGVKSRVTKNPS